MFYPECANELDGLAGCVEASLDGDVDIGVVVLDGLCWPYHKPANQKRSKHEDAKIAVSPSEDGMAEPELGFLWCALGEEWRQAGHPITNKVVIHFDQAGRGREWRGNDSNVNRACRKVKCRLGS